MNEEEIVKRFTIVPVSNRKGAAKRVGSKFIYSGLCDHCGDVFFQYQINKSIESRGMYCGNKCSGAARWLKDSPRDRFVTDKGYVKIRARNHPRASKYGRHVLEHTIVMERMIGRYLTPEESVHHKNGIRTDNRPENLELWVSPQRFGQRVSDLVHYVMDSYEKEVRTLLSIKDSVLEMTAKISQKVEEK